MSKKVKKDKIVSDVDALEKQLKFISQEKKEGFIKIAVTLPELMKLQEESKLVGWDGKGIATIRK